MIKIEYDLSLEDEINNIEVTREYVSQLPLSYWQNGYLFPILFLFMNLIYVWQYLILNIPFREESIFSIVFNFIFSGLSMPQVSARFSAYSWLPKYRIRRYWWRNPNSTKPRKVIITDTEFVFESLESYLFLEENKKVSYLWHNLRNYFI